jgi:large subunit ribosomal protein L9
MKVVMLKDVAKVGQHGQIKDIADGYALNFLIPKGFAEQATPEKVVKVQAQMKIIAAAEAEKSAKESQSARKLDGAAVTVEAKANEKGHLYKQLSTDVVAAAINAQQGIDVSSEMVHFSNPIKETGESKAEVRFGAHEAKITIVTKAV